MTETKQPTDIREVYWPGKIAVANDHGHFPGCKAVYFKDAFEMNKYFDQGAEGDRCLLVSITPADGGGYLCLYTKRLDPEEQEEMDFVSRAMSSQMDELRAKRAKAKQDAETAKENAERELARLAKLGAVYEERMKKAEAMPDGKEKKAAIATIFDGKDADLNAIAHGTDTVEEKAGA